MSLSDGDAVVYLNFMGGKQDEEAHVYGNSPVLINLGHCETGSRKPTRQKDSDSKSFATRAFEITWDMSLNIILRPQFPTKFTHITLQRLYQTFVFILVRTSFAEAKK